MMWQHAGISLFAFAIVCEQAHVASPIVLAWSHPGLRRIALSRPIETMLLPVAAIAGALLAPFMLIWWVYWVWNAFHFGAQHYGVIRILGRRVDREFIIAATMVLMLWVPLAIPQPWWWRWFMLVAIDFNHWLIDIGLSSRVSRRWWLFLLAVIPFGLAGFLWKVPRADHIATLAIPWVVQARWSVGIAHFLYSRWVWKLSDPQVRAAIGKELFA
jgi:hypothetical protein